mmetsp:Transcript_14240/g.35329  ORF Transcript_14240/g.35329 Transcript_14240/m.35329 type:complete len:209 (-) Transcript_14240:1985-2611(-)
MNKVKIWCLVPSRSRTRLRTASDALVLGFLFLFCCYFRGRRLQQCGIYCCSPARPRRRRRRCFLLASGRSFLDGELDRFDGSLSPKVVLARFKPQFPPVEVHACQLLYRAILHVNVQRLALVDIRAAVRRQLEDALLSDLPAGFVQLLCFCRYLVDRLHGAVVCDEPLLHFLVPDPLVNQVLQEVAIDLDEFAAQHPPHVDILRVRLK